MKLTRRGFLGGASGLVAGLGAASDAIAAIMEAAGLSVDASPRGSMLPAVVFYHLPLDVNKASADAIVARFGVSKELAEFIVAARTNSPKD